MSCVSIRTQKFSILLACTAILFSQSQKLPAYAQEPGSDNNFEAEPEQVYLDDTWTYASYSAIHTGCAYLYRAGENSAAGEDDGAAATGDAAGQGNADSREELNKRNDRRSFTVCVNAGHGTSGGSNEQTLSHPDGTPKVTGGTTSEGAVYSTAISAGTTFLDGTSEADANLTVALALKEMLLSDGYDVLMIREGEDVQLDNIARTVIANNVADIHVAIHFDSTESDKGAYYCSVPDAESYRTMEPVASHWQDHERLGAALVQGFADSGLTVFGSGSLTMDLTQTSYSTIPSVDIEAGDRASSHSPEACEGYALALKQGIDYFFEEQKNS